MKTSDNPIHHPLTPPFTTRRRSFWPMARLAAAFTAILAGSVVSLQAQAPISFTLATAKSQAPGILSPYLDANRIGPVGITFGEYLPGEYLYTGTNTQLVTLYQNAGIKLFSIGGNASDSLANTTNDLNSFMSFCQAADIQANFLLEVPNSSNNPSILGFTNIDETNALFMMQNYSNNVMWLSIGNELDARLGAYGQTWTGFTDWWPYWKTYYTDIKNYLQANGAPVPAFGGLDIVNGQTNWDVFFYNTNETLYGANNDIFDVNLHWEPYTHGGGDDNFEDNLDMLNSNTEVAFSKNVGCLGLAKQHGIESSFTEFNAFNGSGQAANNTLTGYSYSLFTLDAMRWWGAQGQFSLNFLDGPGGLFYYPTGSDTNYEAGPIMYGMAAYNLGGGADAYRGYITGDDNLGHIVAVTKWANPNGINQVTAYAVADYGADGNPTNLYVTIINESLEAPGSGRLGTNILANFVVGMPYPGVTRIHRMVLLQTGGNNLDATNGITLGNADLNGGGPFQPQWEDKGILDFTNYIVTVTNTTAQILEFSDPNN